MLGGTEWRKRLENRTKPNGRLFGEYIEIIKASKSHKWYLETKRILGGFHEFLGEFPPTLELFTSYFQHFNVPQIRQSTRARYYYVFSAFFKWYDGSSLPFKVKSFKPVPQKVSDEEVEKLKACLRNRKTHKGKIERDILIVDTFCHTGLRLSELARLRKSELRLGGTSPYLIVLQGKGGKDRTIPLNPYICAELDSYTRHHTSDQNVFGIAPKTINSFFTFWAAKAGVPQIHPHSLRHKFATDILTRGGSIRDVQHLLGHESLSTTEVYLAVTDEGLKKSVGLLDTTAERYLPAPPRQENSESMEKLNQSVNDIKKKLGIEPEKPEDDAPYFEVNVARDEDGNPGEIKINGEIPIDRMAEGLAKFVEKHVRFKKS
jgi:integrase/recombinase XerD